MNVDADYSSAVLKTLFFFTAARDSEERGLVSDGCPHHTPSLVRLSGSCDSNQ